MNSAKWKQVNDIFNAALQRAADEREQFLSEICRGDDDLRREVESLLASFDDASGFLQKPAVGEIAEIINRHHKLEQGVCFGHYEIIKQIGAGGMGEVYLAEDKRLDRKVAVKILSEKFSKHESNLQRFIQEAKAASALNHPNILVIHEIGESENSNYIVSEFIEGETLREVIQKSPLKLSEILDISTQIAGTLVAAHTAKIVHRDIKPENIIVRPDGYVKILDFGLAKLVEQKSFIGLEDKTAKQNETAKGLILGTVNYMSPEQAKGERIDARTDIFSFGIVLYEMIAGKTPFAGNSMSETFANLINSEPQPLSRFSEGVPEELQRIVAKTLRKKKDERYQTMKGLLGDLKDLRENLAFDEKLERSHPPNENATAILSAQSSANQSAAIYTKETSAAHSASSAEYIAGEVKKHKTGAAIALLLLAFAVAGAGYAIYRYSAAGQKQNALSFQSAKITRLTTSGKASVVAISPDGKYVVHVQDEGGQRSLWTRQVATQSNVQIIAPAPVAYYNLTFSPDGNYIYYSAQSQEIPVRTLFRLPTLGGTPQKVSEKIGRTSISFAPDGKQFAFTRYEENKESTLMIADADGTNERKLTAHKNPPDYVNYPAWSPDGKKIIYAVLNAETNDTALYEAQVADGSTKPLTAQKWFMIGGLAWMADGSSLLMLAATQENPNGQIWQLSYPEAIAQRLTNDLDDYVGMSLATDSNTLAVIKSITQANIWVAPKTDATRAQPITSGVGNLGEALAWTPDGRIVYTGFVGGNFNIWMVNADGTNPKQLTANSRYNSDPAVSPDNRYIVFTSDRGGTPHLWRMNIDGGDPKQLVNSPLGEGHPQFSPDGHWIVYDSFTDGIKTWKVSADGSSKPIPISDKVSTFPSVSPDGKLIAYLYGDENAPFRLAVAPFEGGEPIKTFALSPNFTYRPILRWTSDGRFITYIETKNGVSNIAAQPMSGGTTKQLTDFKTDRIFSFDFSPDGKQLALSRGTVNSDVVLISNFK